MSIKSIILSIVSVALMVALLFGVVALFSVNIVLGIVGIVLWMIIPGGLLKKAYDEARGILDRVLARYIAPVIGAFLVLGTILYIVMLFIE